MNNVFANDCMVFGDISFEISKVCILSQSTKVLIALRGVGAAPDGERKQVFVSLRVCYTFCSYFVCKVQSESVFVQLDVANVLNVFYEIVCFTHLVDYTESHHRPA